jgi:hypothetical protein
LVHAGERKFSRTKNIPALQKVCKVRLKRMRAFRKRRAAWLEGGRRKKTKKKEESRKKENRSG